ncbi:MAG TPA: arginine deiminase family protein [Rhizomicrobium sp.]|nr:arginine deiminase family protein [Rhizomicrobium sp.]
MRVFDFTRAIVREPAPGAVKGLRAFEGPDPDFAGLFAQHVAYVAALRAAGLEVEVLAPLEDFPDSMFVEDPALVFPEGAILLAPGAPSRRAEREHMRPVLARHFAQLIALDPEAATDGSDVLVTPDAVFIGLSGRTSRAGAEALAAALRALGRKPRIVETPPGILHFKTASSLVDEETVLATPALAASGVFAGLRVLVTPAGEEAAANALRINDRLFAGAEYPRTADMLARHGLNVTPLGVSEVARLDAGLSCMSLRW